MKDKTKVLNTYGYMFDKLQFVCLIAVYSFSSPPTFLKTSDYYYY